MEFSVSTLVQGKTFFSWLINHKGDCVLYVECCKSKENIVQFYNSHSKMISIPEAALKSTTESISNEVPLT
jgi:hypothetical protein